MEYVVMMLAVGAILAPPALAADLLTQESISRRRLDRFRVGNKENEDCWERHGRDGFYSVVDAHNHFRPFYGPPVPWDTYMDWMRDHGILFTTMLGIGQQLKKKNPSEPDCCYYLHCANYDYPVTPDPINDEENAKDFKTRYLGQPLEKRIHLVPSITFPNLQQPVNNSRILGGLESRHQGVFKWAGEINVYKHALAANGFFANGERVTEAVLNSGKLDYFFHLMEDKQWPVTLHCDLGCDNYDSVPWEQGCFVPESELVLTKRNHRWWSNFLGPHYRAFFDQSNNPKSNFKKIQHLKIWDTMLTRYPKLVAVWAHLGLSKELKHLHPTVHAFIIEKLLVKHKNLHADMSWDVLSKQLFMNYNGANVSVLHPKNHEDLDAELAESVIDTEEVQDLREELELTWSIHKEMVKSTGSITGPTHAMAIYLELFHKHPDRFVTGTDFVSSLGPPDLYPGLKTKPNGCMKDKKNHARQVTDTGSINMFLNDTAFQMIVLGGNYFRINQMQSEFQPPPVCGDSHLSPGMMLGLGIGLGILVIVVAVVVVVLLFCRDNEDASFIRVDSRGNSATTNV